MLSFGQWAAAEHVPLWIVDNRQPLNMFNCGHYETAPYYSSLSLAE